MKITDDSLGYYWEEDDLIIGPFLGRNVEHSHTLVREDYERYLERKNQVLERHGTLALGEDCGD
jgi:hypothetical protein